MKLMHTGFHFWRITTAKIKSRLEPLMHTFYYFLIFFIFFIYYFFFFSYYYYYYYYYFIQSPTFFITSLEWRLLCQELLMAVQHT